MSSARTSRCRLCDKVFPEDLSQDGLCPRCRSSSSVEEAPPTADEAATGTRGTFSTRALPDHIGPYKVLDFLGEGGMGVVYLAAQEQPIRRKVALKVIKLGMDTKEVIARFESERQALALMNHPNIAHVFDAGATERGSPYFVMEFVPGLPITRYCDMQSLNIPERLALFTQVCDGVQHAHQKGIIHRDIKPSNIMVAVRGDKAVPKIIDFGVAKATDQRLTEKTVYTQQGQLIGTPEYMSPEQAEMSGLDVDTRTDVYSLGVLLYELLAGTQPFESRELRRLGYDAIRQKIREEEPPKPSARLSSLGDASRVTAERRRSDPIRLVRELRGDLDWITMRCLEKDRTRRYSSPAELAADVAHHLRHEPMLASPPGTLYRAGKFVRRHKVGVTAAVLVWLALLLGIAGMTFGLLRARKAEQVARAEAESAKQVSDFLVGLFQVSDPNEARGNTITAREILDRGSEKINRELSGEPLVQARMMVAMGRVYRSLGLYDRACRLLEEGLKVTRKTRGEKHLDVAYCEIELAWLYRNQGKRDEALALSRDALSIEENALGPDDRRVAYALQYVGMMTRDAGQYAEARQMLDRSLAVREKALGPNHVEVAHSLYHLGWLLKLTGNLEGARQNYERALSIFKSQLGPDDWMVAWCLNDLAVVYENMGNLDKSLPLQEQALAIKEKIFGPEHPDVAASLNNLGVLFWRMRKFEEAERVYRRALAIRQKVLGPGHLDVAETLENMGLLYRQKKDYDQAQRLFEQSLAITEKTAGPDHQATAGALLYLAELFRQRHEYAKAKPLFERALAINEKILGADNPELALILYGLADLAVQQGNYDRAEPVFRRLLAIREKTPDAIDPSLAETLAGYAALVRKMGRIDEADKLDTRVRAIREKHSK